MCVFSSRLGRITPSRKESAIAEHITKAGVEVLVLPWGRWTASISKVWVQAETQNHEQIEISVEHYSSLFASCQDRGSGSFWHFWYGVEDRSSILGPRSRFLHDLFTQDWVCWGIAPRAGNISTGTPTGKGGKAHTKGRKHWEAEGESQWQKNKKGSWLKILTIYLNQWQRYNIPCCQIHCFAE